MILLVALLMSSWCLGLSGAAALERIDKCGTRCSKGIRCKTKPHYFFQPPCQNPGEGLNVSIFQNVSLSTVMRCEGRQKCSLHLRIKTALQLAESIRGLSICTVTAGMMSNCEISSFKKASHQLKVEVENDCAEISPSQHVKITVKTVPSYCGITWTGTYKAPDCSNIDLQRNVPECITGRLSYKVIPEKKELRVNVSDMLEDHDYHLRLCKKDFICAGTGAHTLIKKEEPVKSATFSFPQPLPCLCIEGWSAVTDALRVQVCPFKDRMEELWVGINFDPLRETLSWEPACPVTAVVRLCQIRDDGVCVDLPRASQNVSRAKVSFTKVDPHPQLCMKFTTGSQSWTRCPFADSRFQAWELAETKREGHKSVEMSSRITANFSVELCVKPEGSDECKVSETSIIHVEKNKAVGLTLKGKLCNTCIQVKRLHIDFGATVTHCFQDCNKTSPLSLGISRQASKPLRWVVITAGICLSCIIIVTLSLHVMLTVYQKRKQKRDAGYTSEKQTDVAPECVISAFQTQALVPDSPPCWNTEKAILISD
ncbi:putative interleukin-17 receptor E-like isoform X2 [Xyrichtys novacula]|uniref:Interleukin-17 receptor E-like isoform X2 n=1 Tax=Xyrichtys novacula TaxID=13765 RepID=A0AAV1F366_XYRNO|nr:putative interleukin-17 receptor E-like isoform X2 [Xyrichtys novacula]